MKVHFYQNDGQLKMWSSEPIEAPSLEHIELELSDAEFEMLKNGDWQMRIENNKPIFNKNPRIKRLEDIANLKEKIEKGNIKNVLNDIVNLLN